MIWIERHSWQSASALSKRGHRDPIAGGGDEMLRARRNNRGGAVSARSRNSRLAPVGPTAVTRLSANSDPLVPCLPPPPFRHSERILNMASHHQKTAHSGSWRNSRAQRSANEAERGSSRRGVVTLLKLCEWSVVKYPRMPYVRCRVLCEVHNLQAFATQDRYPVNGQVGG